MACLLRPLSRKYLSIKSAPSEMASKAKVFLFEQTWLGDSGLAALLALEAVEDVLEVFSSTIPARDMISSPPSVRVRRRLVAALVDAMPAATRKRLSAAFMMR